MAAPLSLVLTACSSEKIAADPLGKLAASREKWQAAKPRTYRYVYTRYCECLPQSTGPFRVTADGDSLLSVVKPGPLGDSSLTPGAYAYLAVDSVFAKIEAYLQRGVHRSEIVFDNTYGFPTDVNIDIDASMADEEYILSIRDFKIVTP